MIQMQTKLKVADNSGAKLVQCIKVLGGSKRRTASVGDIIVVSIKEALPNSKVKKGDVAKVTFALTKTLQFWLKVIKSQLEHVFLDQLRVN